MGKSSGGIRNSSRNDIVKVKGDGGTPSGVKNIGSIRDIADKVSNREVKRAISKYHSRVGLNTREVKIADLKNAYGIAAISSSSNSGTVYLDRKSFNNSKTLIKAKKAEYKRGIKVETNKAIQHTTVHELAHVTWTNHHSGTKHKQAGKEISKLYREYKRSKSNSLGEYASTNVNEFYAEGMSKAILGKKDKYSSKLLSITKKYKL